MLRAPSVSIGLPVFNGERFLSKAIESLLSQEFEDFELIISDNASSDGTRDICERYANQDQRIRYYRNATNIGAAPNHNRVFHLANGRYFKWAAHDDENCREFLQRCVEVLDRMPESVVLAYPQADLIDEDSAITGRYTVSIDCASRRPHARLGAVLDRIVLGTPVYGVVRTQALHKTRLLGSYVGADYALLAELSMLGSLREVPLPLLRKRIHAGRSMEAYADAAERMVWFDTRNAGHRRVLGTDDRLTVEYLRSILYLSLGPIETLKCAVVAVRLGQRARVTHWKGRVSRSVQFLTRS